MRFLKKGPPGSRPERRPPAPPITQEEVLERFKLAASSEGKTLGEWMYEALAGPFGFRNPWNGRESSEKRKGYERAAKALAARLAHAATIEGPHS